MDTLLDLSREWNCEKFYKILKIFYSKLLCLIFSPSFLLSSLFFLSFFFIPSLQNLSNLFYLVRRDLSFPKSTFRFRNPSLPLLFLAEPSRHRVCALCYRAMRLSGWFEGGDGAGGRISWRASPLGEFRIICSARWQGFRPHNTGWLARCLTDNRAWHTEERIPRVARRTAIILRARVTAD